jgi:hypothetical protein
MQNHFLVETEVSHRWGEWERFVAETTKVSPARLENGRKHWSLLPLLVLAHLRAFAAPPVAIRALRSAGGTWSIGPRPGKEVVAS